MVKLEPLAEPTVESGAGVGNNTAHCADHALLVLAGSFQVA